MKRDHDNVIHWNCDLPQINTKTQGSYAMNFLPTLRNGGMNQRDSREAGHF